MKRVVALILTLVSLLSLLSGCGTPAKVRFENTEENRQRAILETALAFYYHNPYIQYESKPLSPDVGSMTAHDNDTLPPEAAGFDRPLYTVCSNFIHKVTEQSLGYRMAKVRNYRFFTANAATLAATNPLVVYKFGDEDGKQDPSRLIQEITEVIQPGDFLVWYRKNGSGHAVVYVGDLFGTGVANVLESGGGHMDTTTGEDAIERSGTILKQDFLTHNMTEKWVDTVESCVVLRPWTMDTGVLTPTAQVRLRYSKMELWKKFSSAIQQNVTAGETLTATVEITNHSDTPYQNLTLREPIPEGYQAENIQGKGKEKDGVVTWTLTVPAGETVTVGFDITVKGSIGDVISFPVGYVDDALETRAAEFKIGGKRISDTQAEVLIAQKENLQSIAEESTSATDFVNRAYQSLFGVNPELPATAQELINFTTRTVQTDSGDNFRTPCNPSSEGEKYYANMVIAGHLSGTRLMPTYGTDAVDGEQTVDAAKYVNAYWQDFYLPGDVFIVYRGSAVNVWEDTVEAQLLLDRSHVAVFSLAANGKPHLKLQTFYDSVQRNKIAKFVIGLRPSQVGLFD